MKTLPSIIAAAAVLATSATVAESQSTKPGATNQAATVSLAAEDDRAIQSNFFAHC